MNARCRSGSNGPPLHIFRATKVLKHWLKHKHRLALKSDRASSESVVVKRLRTQQEEAYTSKLFIWKTASLSIRNSPYNHIDSSKLIRWHMTSANISPFIVIISLSPVRASTRVRLIFLSISLFSMIRLHVWNNLGVRGRSPRENFCESTVNFSGCVPGKNVFGQPGFLSTRVSINPGLTHQKINPGIIDVPCSRKLHYCLTHQKYPKFAVDNLKMKLEISEKW